MSSNELSSNKKNYSDPDFQAVVAVNKINKKHRCPDFSAVKKSFYQAGLDSCVKPGQKVLIKPNLVAIPPDQESGATTRAEISESIAMLVGDMGAFPVIADSAAVGVHTEDVIQTTGYDKLRRKGYEVKDLKRDETIEFEGTKLYKTAAEADVIISAPVMKTHDQFEVSLGIKNLKGLLPDKVKKDFHRNHNLAKALSSFLKSLLSYKQVFTLMDGVVALQGRGPVFGTRRYPGLILASRDMVALDSIAAMVMGVGEEELYLEKNSATKGLGFISRENIKIVGGYDKKSIPVMNFERGKEVGLSRIKNFGMFFSHKTCTGCKNTVISCLHEIKQEIKQEMKDSYLANLANKKIIAGEDVPVFSSEFKEKINLKPGDELILVGACTIEQNNILKYLETFDSTCVKKILGCPPEINDVLSTLIDKRHENVLKSGIKSQKDKDKRS